MTPFDNTMDSPESDREKALFRSPFSLYSNVRNAYKGMRKTRPTSAHYEVAVGDPHDEKVATDLTGETRFFWRQGQNDLRSEFCYL